ncbi:argininosuccinate lyase [Halobacteroides halobius DSM 5150]|uniref:Argininosuccinate lyase n=1 Tax=Halobacteroides halobius (strain ATCC 35273 / DSM 5150 / MD-1) TaxID=748449 RepID=L0KBU3_HALHC|nr:argininosuccinate lyase [Halobacteroides halobius]AGB41563.1 argininosuccinate lyase [Halobacteroides halobius DSM 5150]
MKMWDGRFKVATDKLLEEFNASIGFDYKLAKYDIQGSIAHAKMLAKCNIITKQDKEKIIAGLKEILAEVENDEFEFKVELEDIHMNIEHYLTEKIGPVGGKLHTARSRNDQVALDVRLYLKDQIEQIQNLIKQFQDVLLDLAKKNIDLIMPGYTHLQRAQPIRASHHLLAYQQKLKRDYQRLDDCYQRVDILPLGSGALAGTKFDIDRDFVAQELGFSQISQNTLDAVSERDFVIEFLSTASTIMMHLSRFSEELILWSSSEFQFIAIADAFCTGSSIMPQKKNPDIPELVRGKTGRVYGNLIQLLTTMKGLPLAYNKDMQEDKEGLFDTVDTLKVSLEVMSRMLANTKFNRDKMIEATEKGFVNATDVADYLVEEDIPFRQAHEIVGELVFYCLEKDKKLSDLSLEEWGQFSEVFNEDIYQVIDIKNCVDNRNVVGGPAKDEVLRVIKREQKLLNN